MLPVKYCIKDDFKRGQSLSEFARRSTMTLDVENAVRNILSGCKERSVSCSRGVALLVFGAILEKDGQLQSIQDVNQGLLTQHINESIIKICDNTHPVSLATLNLQIEYKSLRQVRDLKLQKDIGWMTKQIGDMLHQHRHVPYGAQDSTFLSRLEKDVHSYVRKTARLLSERGIFSETVNNRIVRAISPNVLRLSVESFALSSSAEDKHRLLQTLSSTVLGRRVFDENRDLKGLAVINNAGIGICDFHGTEVTDATQEFLTFVTHECGACPKELLSDDNKMPAPDAAKLQHTMVHLRQLEKLCLNLLLEVNSNEEKITNVSNAIDDLMVTLEPSFTISSELATKDEQVDGLKVFQKLGEVWQELEGLLFMRCTFVKTLDHLRSDRELLKRPSQKCAAVQEVPYSEQCGQTLSSVIHYPCEENLDGMNENVATISPVPPRAMFEGYCLWTLVTDGLVLKGDPSLGMMLYEGDYFCFASKSAMNAVEQDPITYLDRLVKLCLDNPELIELMGVHELLPCLAEVLNVASILSAQDLAEPLDYNDASTMTPRHFVQRRVDKIYEWNEWELRRRALKLVEDAGCSEYDRCLP